MKESVFLWKPGLDDGSQNELPNLGMGIVAAELINHGHEVFAVDGHFAPLGQSSINLAMGLTDVFALSLTSFEWTLPFTQYMITLAHEKKKTVVVGGPHVNGYWDLMADDPRIDHLVRGEMDGQYEKFMAGRSEKVINLGHATTFTTPNFRDVLWNASEMEAYPLALSRGCTPGRCSFCMGRAMHGAYRKRPLEDAIDELNNVFTDYLRVKKIYIVDDAFTADIENAKEFLRYYYESNFPAHLQVMNVRADQLDSEFLRLLKRCGCDTLSLGVESGDPDVFGAIGKGETLDDIRRGITMIQKAGITPWLNFIVGLPGDNPVRHRNSVEWAKSIDEPRIVHWFQFSPFRGTRAFKQLVKEGAIDDDFIPSPYGRKYSELPWDADFETVDFSKEQRAYAQLSGFMECDSPVVAASKKAWAMTPESVWELYVMRNKEKIDTYMRESVPDKQRRGQL